MPANLEVESTLTDRYQTTVPETVRRALHLGKRDKILYSIRESGEVVLSRSGGTEDEDPALVTFLSFFNQSRRNNYLHIFSFLGLLYCESF